MIDPLARYVRPAPSYGQADPVSAVAGAVTAVFSFAGEIVGGVTGAKSTRDQQIAQVAAVNPCVARVQAQIASLGAKPVWYVTDKQKQERDLRVKLETRLREMLRDPMACPEVAANKAAQDAQLAANARATTAYYTIGAVGLVGALAVGVIVARRRKKP